MKYNSQLVFQSKFGNIKIISKEERISNIDFTTENIKNSNSKILNATKNISKLIFLIINSKEIMIKRKQICINDIFIK